MLQAVAASAIAAVATGNRKNQEDVIKEGAAKYVFDICLVKLFMDEINSMNCVMSEYL